MGIVLLIASFAWGMLFSSRASWTPEKSQQMADLGNKANLLKFELINSKSNPSMHAGKNPAELQAEFDKVSAEYDKLFSEFKGVRDSPKQSSRILQWAGIAFVAAGALATFANKG